ncbi:hypothetical protein AVEN_201910-1 [Araneus ventricosus]|uniref:Uncharacterized protein n=1 Tax=Araneus ventricosus TaxID=182803 RepID=A0A4Y2T9U0_ARAVE|nr:hypothetical protein AVEN_275547-1 [Araneus ventricosus]GBN96785.1 hypothetical protein AVEN_201910-1 [Araneus ventricosus]
MDLVILNCVHMTRTTPELAPSLQTFTPAGGRLTPLRIFNVQQAQYTTDLQCNRVSNLEPTGSKAEILPIVSCNQGIDYKSNTGLR